MPDPAPHPLSFCALTGTVVGFDFGGRRTGVATGELALGIAHPLTVIDTEVVDQRFAAIAAIVHEWQPALFVVGLPRYLDGAEHEMTRRCQKFARQLEGRFQRPAVLVDERLTSREASQRLHGLGVHGVRHRGAEDTLAAALILQTFFDARSARQVR